MENDTPSLEELTIGFIGIGGAGSIGTETVRKLLEKCILEQKETGRDYINKIYIKNSDKNKKIIIENVIGQELLTNYPELVHKVEYAPIERMNKKCNIIVTSFETTCGAQHKEIPLDNNFRQNLFNGNINVLYDKHNKKTNNNEIGLITGLKNYKGLIINATNPLEGMCYWMLKLIPGLEKDQIIGFMPDTDRFNLLCKQYYKMHSAHYKNLDKNELRLLIIALENGFIQFQNSFHNEAAKGTSLIEEDTDKLKQVFVKQFNEIYAKRNELSILNEEEIKKIVKKISNKYIEILNIKYKIQKENIEHDFNEQFKKFYEQAYDLIKKDQLLEIDMGFILGEHSPNLVGAFSPIRTPGHEPWNLEEFNKSIADKTAEWGLKLIRKRKNTGQEVCVHLANLIRRIYKEARGELSLDERIKFCSQTHYINLPEEIRNELEDRLDPKKYDKQYDVELTNCLKQLAGICTGVPVRFKLDKNGLRATLDPRYDARYNAETDPRATADKDGQNGRYRPGYDFDFEKLNQEKDDGKSCIAEKELFIKCIRQTVLGKNGRGSLLETVILNEREKKPRYLTENEVVALIADNDLKELTFHELKKTNKPLIQKGHKIPAPQQLSNCHYKPSYTAIAADKNIIAAAIYCSGQTIIKIFNATNVCVDDLIGKTPKAEIVQMEEIVLKSNEILDMILKGEDLYLSELYSCYKINIKNKKIIKLKKSLDEAIFSMHHDFDSFYCGSFGKINAFNSNLERIIKDGKEVIYETGSGSPIIKIKSIRFDNIDFLFGINSNGQIFKWFCGNPLPIETETIATKGISFDIAEEEFKEVSLENEKVLCIYYIGDDGDIFAKPTTSKKCTQPIEAKTMFDDIKISNPCGEFNLLDLQVKDDSLSIFSDNSVHRILEKSADLIKNDLLSKGILKFCIAKYCY